MKPCIGLLEFSGIAIGLQATDAMLKKATIEVLLSYPVSQGKYLTMINGEVEEVRSALEQGREVGRPNILDELFIPNLHPAIIPALDNVRQAGCFEALGILETRNAPSCIMAADTVLKTAAVELITLRLCRGIGGKAYFVTAGEIGDVEAAMAAGVRLAKHKKTLLQEIIIPQAHPKMWPILVEGKTGN